MRRRIAYTVFGVAFSLTYAGFLLHVLSKVKAGQGLDTYHSYKLVEWNYLGALIVLVSVPLVLLLGILFSRWHRYSEQRAFLKETERVMAARTQRSGTTDTQSKSSVGGA